MKRFIECLSAIVLPTLVIGFLVAEHFGVWDRWLGLDEVEKIAARFETSYARNVDRRVGPDEPGWQPLLKLIRRYSAVSIPENREPYGLARSRAILSGQLDLGDRQIAEWTAPSTPILLVFKEVSAPLAYEDVLPVGSIGDLRVWCDRRRADLKFIVQDVLFALTGIVVGFVLWRNGSN